MMSTLVERVSRWPCISTYFKSLKGVPTGVDSDANQSLRTFESGGFCTFGNPLYFWRKSEATSPYCFILVYSVRRVMPAALAVSARWPLFFLSWR